MASTTFSGPVTSQNGFVGSMTGTTAAVTGTVTALSGSGLTAGGAAGFIGTNVAAGMGIYFGSGAPTIAAAKGSLYLRSDGSTTNDRAYINTNGSTTWTALTTAA